MQKREKHRKKEREREREKEILSFHISGVVDAANRALTIYATRSPQSVSALCFASPQFVKKSEQSGKVAAGVRRSSRHSLHTITCGRCSRWRKSDYSAARRGLLALRNKRNGTDYFHLRACAFTFRTFMSNYVITHQSCPLFALSIVLPPALEIADALARHCSTHSRVEFHANDRLKWWPFAAAIDGHAET